MVGPAAAHPKTWGPIRIPKPISTTTKGSRIHGTHSHKNGAKTAMEKMSSREFNSWGGITEALLGFTALSSPVVAAEMT
jgi:hypothetical protein